MAKIVDRIVEALSMGKKLLLVGNGGSAADVQHIAGEFLSRLNYDRAPIAAIALTTDSSVMTAIGNDYGYERLFDARCWDSDSRVTFWLQSPPPVARPTSSPRSGQHDKLDRANGPERPAIIVCACRPIRRR